VIEEAQVVVHEGDEPDLLGRLLDADVLTGKGVTEIDLSAPDTDATAARRMTGLDALDADASSSFHS
jgi:hypothetical protein